MEKFVAKTTYYACGKKMKTTKWEDWAIKTALFKNGCIVHEFLSKLEWEFSIFIR